MRHFLAITILILTALASVVRAQDNQATGELFVRIEGEEARAAIQVKIERGWHLYHGPTREDIGPSDAVGKPLVITMSGTDVRTASRPTSSVTRDESSSSSAAD